MDTDDENLIVNRIVRHMGNASDVHTYRMSNGRFSVHIIYIQSVVDSALVHERIAEPFLKADSFEAFVRGLAADGAEKISDIGSLPQLVTEGNAVIVSYNEVYTLQVVKPINDVPQGTQTENTILGPQRSLTEDLQTNLGIIRKRYAKPRLNVEQHIVGDNSKTKLLLVFDEDRAKPTVIEELRGRLKSVRVDVLQEAGQLQKLLNGQRFSLFPVMMITERPDRVVMNLAQGKIVILMQGTPFALILPAVFYDFMAAMDDLYHSFWLTRMLLLLRYTALFATMMLPALYVAIVSYNPEIFRVQLTLSIAGSRAAVPYPSYVEVLIMLFMIESLIEASLRLPKFIGSTATTVGGLILGQAAQQAGLVSSIMIIITSAVAIANFVIPINAMSFAMRFVKYVLIVFAAMFGVIGIMVGVFLVITLLVRLRSYGEPYLRLYIGERKVNFPEQAGDPG
ncbi:spore germination protein [Paenibacillus chartarius]|uniref:Spore germination protein n=1 Tax=Paenibacillus chartarius TaxID=747481 RepID=A0ABV6DN17_9BACL